MQVKPYDREGSKKEQVAEMFDNISGRYDALNRILSMGIDIQWRKRVVREVAQQAPNNLLDVATGTGDLVLALAKVVPGHLIGLDLSPGMLERGKQKVQRSRFHERIEMMVGDSENLPFETERFDAVSVAFGVRNFENLEAGLAEMQRVTRPGGMVYVLEFSKPKNRLFSKIYLSYFKHVLPRLGKLISGDASAYTYLPESVQAFPDGDAFLACLHEAGYREGRSIPLTGGIATLYVAKK